jgi:hypothetical protein
MKNLFKISIAILVLFAVTFAFFYESRVNELLNDGYTLEASHTIVNVEFKLLPVSADYLAIIED